MPFPLAHPAAVLPLRRYCPKFLSFPALVVGSIAPDAAYCLGNGALETFSHSFWGCFAFSLPVGLAMLVALRVAGCWMVPLLPERCRVRFEPLSCFAIGSIVLVVMSLLVGAWTHVLWDSFTHKQGWFVRQIPALEESLAMINGRHVRVCYVLWYGSSFIGVALVYLSFEAWRRRSATRPNSAASSPASQRRPTKAQLGGAFLVGSLLVPIELIHHLFHGWAGGLLVAFLSLLLVLGVIMKEP